MSTQKTQYVNAVLNQSKHHNIPNRLRRIRTRIDQDGFTHRDSLELDNIDSMMTTIRIQSEKTLVPPPTPYKHTAVGKR